MQDDETGIRTGDMRPETTRQSDLCGWDVSVTTQQNGDLWVSAMSPGEMGSLYGEIPPLIGAVLGRMLAREAIPGLERIARLIDPRMTETTPKVERGAESARTEKSVHPDAVRPEEMPATDETDFRSLARSVLMIQQMTEDRRAAAESSPPGTFLHPTELQIENAIKDMLIRWPSERLRRIIG